MRALREYPVAGATGAVSPAGRRLALGSEEGTVRLLDLRTGSVVTAAGRHAGAVTTMRFSPDGGRLLTAGTDDRLIVWDTARAVPVETLSSRGRVTDLAIAPDGRTAYSAGRDGTVVAWDLAGTRRLERPFRGAGSGPLRLGAVSSLGSPMALLDEQGTVRLFNGRSSRPVGAVRIGSRPPLSLAVARNGRTLAAASVKGDLAFWDVPTRRRVSGTGPVNDNTWMLDFSGDGRWLVAGGGGTIAYLWDVRRRKVEQTVERSILDASLSRDGATLALTLRDDTFSGGLELFSVPDLTPIRTVRVPAGRFGRFAADGRSFVYGDRHGRVWILDARTWKPRHRPLDARGQLTAADLSPDGRRLATTHDDGTARLWDVASGRQIGGPLPTASGDVFAAAFTGSNAELAVLHGRGGYVWDVRPESWEQRACAVAGRRLTRAEWRAALPGRDYAPAC